MSPSLVRDTRIYVYKQDLHLYLCCMYTHIIYTCIYIYMDMYIYIYTIYKDRFIFIYIFIYLYIYIFIYLYIYIFIYLYIYIFIYLYICIYVFIFIYIDLYNIARPGKIDFTQLNPCNRGQILQNYVPVPKLAKNQSLRPLGSKVNAGRITPPISFKFVYQNITRFMHLSLQIKKQLMLCQPLGIFPKKTIEKKHKQKTKTQLFD